MITSPKNNPTAFAAFFTQQIAGNDELDFRNTPGISQALAMAWDRAHEMLRVPVRIGLGTGVLHLNEREAVERATDALIEIVDPHRSYERSYWRPQAANILANAFMAEKGP